MHIPRPVVCLVNQRVFLSCICLLVLVSLIAVPALAATVTCPSSCSCLFPADAKKLDYPGYCSGKQAICGYDTQKNEKYCYTKPVTTTNVPQLIFTAKPYVTTTPTTVPPQKCASGCSCLSSADGKGNDLLYCGGKQTLCGYDSDKTPLYCFARATTPTTTPTLVTGLRSVVTTTAEIPSVDNTRYTTTVSCPAGCTCLPSDKADAAGFKRCGAVSAACGKDPLGRPTYCYTVNRVTAIKPVPAETTAMLIPAVIITTPGTASASQQGTGFTLRSLFATLTGSPPRSSTSSQLVRCNGSLTDMMADPANCGSCGTLCSEGEECTMGTCTGPDLPLSSGCGPRQIRCNSTCTYFLSDDNNCGGCGNRCGVFETCCNGRCTNTNSDPENCHDCGTSCGADGACSYGLCTCTNNTLMCGSRCVDTRIDNENCGGCNYRCGAGKTCCYGACTDTDEDLYNCGTCYHFCESPYSCRESRCVDIATSEEHCGTNGVRCGYRDEICCSGRCVTWTSDNNNCGGCGNACGNGETCCNGLCIAVSSYSDDFHNCGSCGNECYSSGTSSSLFLEYCCAGRCTNTDRDDFNCGSCGNECPWYASHCFDGFCYSSLGYIMFGLGAQC
jgi:hypothetical protein